MTNNKQYTLMELREDELDPDPFRQFDQWYNEVLDSDIKYPDAVTLSTADKNGKVSSRIVLLKGVDDKGFRFYTNSYSRKGRQIGENPFASLCFWWESLERQVRISGNVEILPATVSEQYFRTRPRGSQISAWASSQSDIIPNRQELEKKYIKYEKMYEQKEIPKPDFWNGYRIVPCEFEFWQGRENRLHDRLLYTPDESGNWKIQRLQP